MACPCPMVCTPAPGRQPGRACGRRALRRRATTPPLRVPVPLGTVVKRRRGGALLGELLAPGQTLVVARGGAGGAGVVAPPKKGAARAGPAQRRQRQACSRCGVSDISLVGRGACPPLRGVRRRAGAGGAGVVASHAEGPYAGCALAVDGRRRCLPTAASSMLQADAEPTEAEQALKARGDRHSVSRGEQN